eukprot:COSAG04_NODE_422_length_14618_cov_11.903712_6_plen_114_part_00
MGSLLAAVLLHAATAQPLHDAAAEGDYDRVVVLLERPGIDVNQANKGTRPHPTHASLNLTQPLRGVQTAGLRCRRPRHGITKTFARRSSMLGPTWTTRTTTGGRRCTRQPRGD